MVFVCFCMFLFGKKCVSHRSQERYRMESQDLVMQQEHEEASLMQRLASYRLDSGLARHHATEMAELRKSLDDRQKRCVEETLVALEQEEMVLAESCMVLDAEEAKLESQMELESEEAAAVHRIRLEVGKLETLRNRLEAFEENALSTRRRSSEECVFWENRIQHYADVRQELTDSAWVMSHELQEKMLATEAAAKDLKNLKPLTQLEAPQLREQETEIRVQMARAEKALAPKQREVAAALLD